MARGYYLKRGVKVPTRTGASASSPTGNSSGGVSSAYTGSDPRQQTISNLKSSGQAKVVGNTLVSSGSGGSSGVQKVGVTQSGTAYNTSTGSIINQGGTVKSSDIYAVDPMNPSKLAGQNQPQTYSATPGGSAKSAQQIAAITPGYSLAPFTHPLESTINYLKYQKGKSPIIGSLFTTAPGITKEQYSSNLNKMEVKDIQSGLIFKPEGGFKVSSDQGTIQNYFGVRQASPTVRILEAGAIGAVGGFALKGISVGAGTISPLAGKATNVAILGAGVVGIGFYGVQSYKQIKAEPTTMGKYEVGFEKVGTLGLGAFGFAQGSQAFTSTQGYFATIGRKEIPLVKLTKAGTEAYPTIPKSQQLKAFQTGSYKEYSVPTEISGGQQGAFHTTSFRFYGTKQGSLITPKSGTSELSGIYGSTYISTKFSGTAGSYKILPSFKNMFSSGGKPGVAFLKPEGFRVSDYGFSKTPIFKGQKSVNGKYGFFKKPAKAGIADIPLMKTEAEAVFRPEAGNYAFQSGKYYTKINGVRTPIDVFGYSGGKGVSTTGGTFGSMTSARGGYSIPSSQYLLGANPIFLGSKSSTSSSSSSFIPKVPSYSFGKSSSKVSSSYLPSSSGSSSYSAPSLPSFPSSTSSYSSTPSIPSYKAPSSGSGYSYSSSFSYWPASSIIFPGLNMPMGGSDNMFNRKVGAKARRKYTPGFKELILNIKGKAPKMVTGAGSRPIPKGFSFNFGKSKLFGKWF